MQRSGVGIKLVKIIEVKIIIEGRINKNILDMFFKNGRYYGKKFMDIVDIIKM